MSHLKTRVRQRAGSFHDRFGTAGVIIAVIALVAALSGTALAAKGALTGKQKKEVEKIAKKFAGKPGAPGAAGANGKDGSNGTNGTNGAPGADGDDGAPGAPGDPGAPGKSVTVTAVDAGGTACEGRSGAIVEEEGEPLSETEVCEGSPWAAGGILPPGATETGAWSFQKDEGVALAPISFPIAIPAPLGFAGPNNPGNEVHYSTETNFGDFDEAGDGKLGCTGTFSRPKAPPGHLCVFQGSLNNATFSGFADLANAGTSIQRAGGLIVFAASTGGVGSGSFAVKAPCGAGEGAVEELEGAFTVFNCKPVTP